MTDVVFFYRFDDVDEYYHYFAPQRIVPSIRTPTLFLVAKDDPFLGETEQCEDAIRGSGHVSLAHVRQTHVTAAPYRVLALLRLT